MIYRVEFTTAAARQIKKIDRSARDRILAVIESLAHDPRPPASTKLVGEAIAWRVRVGDYRVIYDVDDDVLTVTVTVTVVRAGHRREVYSR